MLQWKNNVLIYYEEYRKFVIPILIIAGITIPALILNIAPHSLLPIYDEWYRPIAFSAGLPFLLIIGVLEICRWKYNKSTIVIIHKSKPFNENGLFKSYPEVKRKEICRLSIEKFCKSKVFDWEKITTSQENFHKEFVSKYPDTKIFVYCGITEVPSSVHLGYLFGDALKFRFHYLYWEPVDLEKPWLWVSKVLPEDWRIDVDDEEFNTCKKQKEICILFQQTGIITEEALEGLKLPNDKLRISINKPVRDNLKAEVEVYRIANKFQKIMNDLIQVLVVHLFIFAPVPVSFAVGQSISKTMHPKVIVYRYQKSLFPRYTPAFILNE